MCSIFYPNRAVVGPTDACIAKGVRSEDCIFQEASTPRQLVRTSFIAVIDVADFPPGGLGMPYNLPEQVMRVKTTRDFRRQLAERIVLGHSTDLVIADDRYFERNSFRFITPNASAERRLRPASVGYSTAVHSTSPASLARELQVAASNSTANKTFCGGAVEGSACFTRGLGCRPSPSDLTLDNVDLRGSDRTWFSTIDEDELGNAKPFGFIALPYLPFFSNCEGYDSYVSLAKLTETHPSCHLENVSSTIWVSQYPWQDQFTPVADKCELSRQDVCENEVAGLPSGKTGVLLNCYYEENIFLVRSWRATHVCDRVCCVERRVTSRVFDCLFACLLAFLLNAADAR